jgi:hypothetical protein
VGLPLELGWEARQRHPIENSDAFVLWDGELRLGVRWEIVHPTLYDLLLGATDRIIELAAKRGRRKGQYWISEGVGEGV